MQPTTQQPSPARKWSSYQQALLDFGRTSSENGLVNAVAGSGKTTIIEELCRQMEDFDVTIKYLVFNKRNADEASARMPANTDVSTFHSACMAPLRTRLGRIKVDGEKCRWILTDMCKEERILTENEFWRFSRAVSRLVGLAKNGGFGTNIGPLIEESDAWQDLIDMHSIEVDGGKGADQDAMDARLIELSQEVLIRSNNQTWRIDFDDMLYYVVLMNLRMPTYDIVCVDEAQDTNSIQRVILGKMIGANGRLIAVGDPRQAIYGFRGATSQAMAVIADTFKCVELPLSINYRCSLAVIEAAKVYCPQLEPRTDAPEGSVEAIETLDLTTVEMGSAVLCRTTVPLIQLAMRMIGKRVPVVVLGRDIGANLTQLVERLRKDEGASTVSQFNDALDDYYSREVQRVGHRRNADALIQALEDRCDSLRALAEPLLPDDPIQKVLDTITALFGDEQSDHKVTLSTVHKAKGLEWPTVYILNRSEMPHKRATQEWQLEQETNLIYVAYTRARVDLRFIELAGIS